MKKIVILVSSLLLITLSIRVTPALAAGITVNTTAQSPGASGDCTLGEAIVAANTDTAVDGCPAGTGTDTIGLPAGTYTLTTADNTDEYGTSNGLPIISSALTITGAGSDTTIVERAADAPPFRILHIYAPGLQVELDGFTVRGGAGSGNPGSFLFFGGGIQICCGSVTLDAMTITANSAGGIHCVSETCKLTLKNSQVADNSGEGIIFYAGAYPSGSLYLMHSHITGNAGIGIVVQRAYAAISDTTITDNGGDGILSWYGALNLLRSTVANNGENGIYSRYYTSAVIEATAIFGNGRYGFFHENSTGSIMRITNTTIAKNRGGIYLQGKAARMDITNTTITDNSGGRGAGIYSAKGTIQITNTILSGNHGGPGADCYGALVSRGHNLFGKIANCQVEVHKGDRLANPRLAAWSDNTTPGNGHYPLLSTSRAIDKASIYNCPTTDQLDNPRVGRCDIGAVEYIPPP